MLNAIRNPMDFLAGYVYVACLYAYGFVPSFETRAVHVEPDDGYAAGWLPSALTRI